MVGIGSSSVSLHIHFMGGGGRSKVGPQKVSANSSVL